MISSPSASLPVTMRDLRVALDDERGVDELAVDAARERGLGAGPAPMLGGDRATVTGLVEARWLPSGRVMTGIVWSRQDSR